MKMIILAGGRKSTISDDPEGMPKPMIPIGGRPLLWHIMKHASLCGISDFIICGGYKVESIKEYFLDYYIYQSDIRVDTAKNNVEILDKITEDWKVTVADTGTDTLPVERVKKVMKYLDDDFLVSYGDCLSDISLNKMVDFHRANNKAVTVAVAKPTGRKMPIRFYETESELGHNNATWTSAGVFIMNKSALKKGGKYSDLEDVMSDVSTSYFRHEGFFSTIETLRDKVAAEELWEQGKAPWMKTI